MCILVFFSSPMHAFLVFSLGNSLNLKKTQTEFFVRFTSQLNVFDFIRVDCLAGHGSQRCKLVRMDKRLQIRQLPWAFLHNAVWDLRVVAVKAWMCCRVFSCSRYVQQNIELPSFIQAGAWISCFLISTIFFILPLDLYEILRGVSWHVYIYYIKISK